MSEVKYLPSEWLDEYIPNPAGKPDDFLYVENGQIWLRPVEDGDKREQPYFWQKIGEGDWIKFSEYRDFGTWTITVGPKRGGDELPDIVGSAGIPAEANCFHSYDSEEVHESLEACIAELLRTDPDFAGETCVHVYAWTESHFGWYLAIVDDCAHFAETERPADA
jgi:hypothetical protein